MDTIARKALLFDFYGPLLTERQQLVYDYAYGEDMSLSEIAELLQISRQAVHDLLRRTDKLLLDYETKLGLVDKFLAIEDRLAAIETILTEGRADKDARIRKEIEAIADWERR